MRQTMDMLHHVFDAARQSGSPFVFIVTEYPEFNGIPTRKEVESIPRHNFIVSEMVYQKYFSYDLKMKANEGVHVVAMSHGDAHELTNII